jgi:hypothetical protein
MRRIFCSCLQLFESVYFHRAQGPVSFPSSPTRLQRDPEHPPAPPLPRVAKRKASAEEPGLLAKRKRVEDTLVSNHCQPGVGPQPWQMSEMQQIPPSQSVHHRRGPPALPAHMEASQNHKHKAVAEEQDDDYGQYKMQMMEAVYLSHTHPAGRPASVFQPGIGPHHPWQMEDQQQPVPPGFEEGSVPRAYFDQAFEERAAWGVVACEAHNDALQVITFEIMAECLTNCFPESMGTTRESSACSVLAADQLEKAFSSLEAFKAFFGAWRSRRKAEVEDSCRLACTCFGYDEGPAMPLGSSWLADAELELPKGSNNEDQRFPEPVRGEEPGGWEEPEDMADLEAVLARADWYDFAC